MPDAVKAANLGLRFVLELGVLAALGYWGFRIGGRMALKIGLAIVVPVAAAAIWVTFGAPGADHQLQDPAHLVLEVLFFGAAALALAFTTRKWIGVAFAAVFVVNRLLMYAWGQ
jgi:hypothetical protein